MSKPGFYGKILFRLKIINQMNTNSKIHAEKTEYDVVVIGGGHAGCEASLVAARLGMKTALVTFDKSRIAEMSCNPSIGGLAKGHIVREIDALGGEMAKAIDSTGIQFRILNRSRGPAVQAPRAQADKEAYRHYFIELLQKTPGLMIITGEAASIEAQNGRVEAVMLADGKRLSCRAAVVTTGTFLNGLIHIGFEKLNAGRLGDPPAAHLSESLRGLGLRLGRFKTGTPARIARDSVDFSDTVVHLGDEPPSPFSFGTESLDIEQVPCWLTYTNEETHDIIRTNLDKSPLYSGVIVGTGPRYCPSIEDKVVKFPERHRHQVFLEPEGRDSELIYPNGISSSLPRDIQEKFIKTIPPLRNAKIIHHAYAIEYDMVYPRQLRATLETREIEGLYLAGQINGTSGYEEAAGQGLVAGINAALKIEGKDPHILKRNEAYIGVMIDDLTSNDVDEPYRMFTSRAEYRILLRCDNADRRLMPLGREIGLVSGEAYEKMVKKYKEAGELRKILEKTIIKESKLTPEEREEYLKGETCGGIALAALLKRPGTDIETLIKKFYIELGDNFPLESRRVAEIETKYRGYLEREERAASKSSRLENRKIPEGFDYHSVPGLSKEGQEKLSRFRPETLGKAGRIIGITPAAVAAINIALIKAGFFNED
jgi:tRNA uridine 5-carboxymethylaminomethyl modification enzyme